MRVATLGGIPIRLHPSFLVLAGLWIAWQLVTHGTGAALDAVMVGVMVFGSVLLHELGHALMGRHLGLRTRDITLFPFGGVAAMEVPAQRPRAELLVALAGPAVNAVLALLSLGLVAMGVPLALELLVVNLGMGLFNLLPAYPMDGGRVLRAWWSLRVGPVRASLRALGIARWFAWAFVGLGFLWSPSLVLVGGFLLVATASEERRWSALARLGGDPMAARPALRPRAPLPLGPWQHPVR